MKRKKPQKIIITICLKRPTVIEIQMIAPEIIATLNIVSITLPGQSQTRLQPPKKLLHENARRFPKT